MTKTNTLADHPLGRMDPTDLSLITAFVLCSGSLKALAKQHGVSYPTIRTRLDGVIQRLQAEVDGKPRDPIAEALADLVQQGEVSVRAAREVLELVRAKDE